MRTARLRLSAAFLLIACLAGSLAAQQVTIGTPFRTGSDRFFEQNGVNFSGTWRGMNFSFGNASLATPQFGGFDPSAGLRTNFALAGRNFQANFGLNFTQGYQQSLVSQTPSVTLMNGQTGFISDTSLTPFVIGQIPVVGGFPTVPNFSPVPPSFFSLPDAGVPPGANPRVQEMLKANLAKQAPKDDVAEGVGAPVPGVNPARPNVGPRPIPADPAANAAKAAKPAPAPPPAEVHGARFAAAQSSSAGRAAPSVAEARLMHEQEKATADGNIQALFERARAAEEDGKPGVARVYYQMVIRRDEGQWKQQAQERLDAIRGTANP